MNSVLIFIYRKYSSFSVQMSDRCLLKFIKLRECRSYQVVHATKSLSLYISSDSYNNVGMK
jgi:hypothetical protein